MGAAAVKIHTSKRAQLLAGVLLMSLAGNSVHADENNVEKFGLYVVVSDMERSIDFYSKLFQKQPYMKTESFAAFDVTGGLYALFSQSASDIERVRGNTSVPYIRVTDASTEHARVAALNARMHDDKVVLEGPLSLFRFSDPDGNVVEFFSVTSRR